MINTIRLAICLSGFLIVMGAASQEARFDQIVPADVVFYVEADASLNAPQSFTHFDEAMRQLGETMSDVLEWRVIMDEWDAALQSADIGELDSIFGARWCLAATGFGKQFNRIPTVIYLADVANEEQAQAYMRQLFEALVSITPVVKIEDDFYDGLPIISLFGPGRIPGLSLSYTLYNNKLILTTSKPLVIDLIDRFDYPGDALADNPDYQSFIQRMPETRSWLSYMPIAGMVESVSSIAKTAKGFAQLTAKGEDKEWADALFSGVAAGLDAVRAVHANGIASILHDGGLQQTTTVVALDSERLAPHIKDIFNRAKLVFPLENYLPRQTGSFSYTNVFTLKDIWLIGNDALQKMPQGEKIKNDLTDFMNKVGLDIERDLLAWMDDAFCIVRPLADLNAVAPANHAALIIGVKDEARLQQSLTKIQDAFVNTMLQFNIPIGANEETHRGVKITSIGSELPFVPITPSWCVDEGRFILSTSVNFIREMIDVRNGRRPNIEKSRDYKALQDKIDKPAHKVAFQDVASEFYQTRESLLRITSFTQLADTTPEQIEMAEALVDRIAYLLGCMQIYRASVKHTAFSEDEIRSEKWVLLKDLRGAPSAANIKRRPITLGMEDQVYWWANHCLDTGDTNRAARLFQNLIKHRPANTDYLAGLAAVYHAQGNPLAAQEAYTLALESQPSVSLVIAREAALGDSREESIRARINEAVNAYPSLDRSTAYFGAALMLRDHNRSEFAHSLLNDASSWFGESEFIDAAKLERRLIDHELNGDFVEDIVAPAQTAQPPEIDGAWNDSATDANATISLQHPPNAIAQFSQSGDALYIGLQVSQSELTSDEAEFRVSLSPSRDYASRYDFSVIALNSGGDWSIVRQSAQKVADDPYDFQLNSANESSGSDVIEAVKTIVHDVTDDQFDWLDDKLFKQDEPKPSLEFLSAIGLAGERLTLEVSIPLSQLKDENTKTVWMVNTAIGQDNGIQNDYLRYVPVEIR